jgi:hypothetical protein
VTGIVLTNMPNIKSIDSKFSVKKRFTLLQACVWEKIYIGFQEDTPDNG